VDLRLGREQRLVRREQGGAVAGGSPFNVGFQGRKPLFGSFHTSYSRTLPA
jgi:hypothetical protein